MSFTLITSLLWQAISKTKVLFEAADSPAKGEITAIQLCTHPSQQKFFDLLDTPKLHAAHNHILKFRLELHSLLNSTEFKDWLVGCPAN